VTKVLYVEHNDDNLYMLKTRLELYGGFEVLAAEDSEKGCRLAATEHPDVILMDLEMPDDDRWETVRHLKKDTQPRDIPIIGMSAHAAESEREKAIATGCEEFNAKPIDFESRSGPSGACSRPTNRCSDHASARSQPDHLRRRFAQQRQTDKQSFGAGRRAVNDVARKSLRPTNVTNHYSLRVGL